MFHPGQQVICINDTFNAGIVEWADNIPKRGCIYTIKRVRMRARHRLTNEPGVGLLLVELPNPNDRLSFCASRFAPIKWASEIAYHVSSVPSASAVNSGVAPQRTSLPNLSRLA